MNRQEFAGAFDVSCETMERLDVYVAQLQKWSRAINLLGPVETEHLWERHVVDCGQLIAHIPDHARSWIDLGSGAGLPGLVVAILADGRYPDLRVTLLEADKRKAAFLREAGRRTGARVIVISERTEDVKPQPFQVVSARAFAPLPRLLGQAAQVAPEAETLLLLKGRTVDVEIEDARRDWDIDWTISPSVTDPDGAVLKITRFTKRT